MKYAITLLACFLYLASLAQPAGGRYELVSLGKPVNTFYHEAAPIVSPDGKTLYFFVQNHPENTYGKEGSQDIWMTQHDDKGAWQAPKRLTAPFNQNRSNQVFNILPDGTLFIRGGRGKNDKGFTLVSPTQSFTYLKVKDFESMEKGRFYGATISADTRHMIIYFSEEEKSIRSDLYVSHQQANGEWTRPEKLSISSKSDEFGCFIGPDNKTLYFASDRTAPNRHGGSDIYKSERLDDSWTNWSDPVNLRKPINTAAGDAYFSMDTHGNVYTSRANSRVDGGNLDLFVLVPKEIKLMLSGVVVDEKDQQPLKNVKVTAAIQGHDEVRMETNASGSFESRAAETAQIVLTTSANDYLPYTETLNLPTLERDSTIHVKIELKRMAKKLIIAGKLLDAKTNEEIEGKVDIAAKIGNDRWSERGAKFSKEVNTAGWYALTGSATGYLTTTDSVYIPVDAVQPVVKDVYLRKLAVGVTVRLRNIYFDFDRTSLKPASYEELNKVVDLLKQNEQLEIEIGGHTDNKGSDDYNINLSQGRSQAVVDYLVNRGVAAARLRARGYGESKPIDRNDTEAGQANNRRVEFTVLKH